MPKFTVHVELTFEDIEARTLDQACSLGEIFCWVRGGPAAKADAIRSYGERCQDGKAESPQGPPQDGQPTQEAGPGAHTQAEVNDV